MSRMSCWGHRPTWLMLAGDVGGAEGVLSGAVYRTDLSVQQGLYTRSVSLSAELDRPVVRTVRRDGGPAPMEAVMWEALQEWPDENAGRRWPPEMGALLALARKHPQEYDEILREERSAAGRSQLLVVPDVFTPDGRVLRGIEALGR